MSGETATMVNTSQDYIGTVKWFNNKSGYGFVTILSEGDMHKKDIFVHHSSINVDSEQYKYLVQGEYVSIYVEKTDNQKYEFQASNIKGVLGGPLMCETRNDIRQQRTDRMKDMEGFQENYKKNKPKRTSNDERQYEQSVDH